MSIVTKESNPELYNSLFEDATIEDAKKVMKNMFNDITPEQFEEIKKQAMENVKLNNMTAKEMFEKLGYELIMNEDNDIPRKSWGGELKRFELVYKNEESLVLFYKDKSIATVEYGTDDDDDRIHFLSYGNCSLNLLQAINKQVEELGWLGSDDEWNG